MKSEFHPIWMGVAATLALSACGGGSGGSSGDGQPVQGAVCTDRAELCAEELLDGDSAKLTLNRYFLPEPGSGAAAHQFMGTLAVSAAGMSSSGTEATGRTIFPGFTVRFITVGDTLLPLNRDIIFGGGPNRWDIILSPGRVWSEDGDQGRSRASFPFTLVTNKWNEAHNGVATFIYDDTMVSDLRFQVAQETAVWNKLNFWGRARANYEPGVVAGAAERAQDYLDEVAARVRTKPWSQLTVDYPAADLSAFTRGIAREDISGTAILVDDTLYYQPAATRAGDYPYPLEMRHGVFSVTKSSAAALTLLRLAEKYGEQVFDLFVTDYLDVTASHNGWNGVTFGHLLSMLAGIGDRFPDPNAAATFADENDSSNPKWEEIWGTFPRNTKLAKAFLYNDYPWAPGQIVRYNTAHTFILGAAMDSFYKTMAGPDVNVWQMMKDEVYRPIGIEVIPTIETVDADPIPIYGFGLVLNAYDTARISQLLDNDGAWKGQQLLHRERTRLSLYKTADNGYSTYVSVPMEGTSQAARYLHSFWSFSLQSAGGGCSARIPYMWGFGGNFVVVLPNGVSAYRYADGDVHDPVALGLAAGTIRPFC